MNLAESFSVSGTNHILILIALILFVIAAVFSWVIPPQRNIWAAFVAAGLALYMLALLFH